MGEVEDTDSFGRRWSGEVGGEDEVSGGRQDREGAAYAVHYGYHIGQTKVPADSARVQG